MTVLADVFKIEIEPYYLIRRQVNPPDYAYWSAQGWGKEGTMWPHLGLAQTVCDLLNQHTIELNRLTEALETIQRVDEHRMWIQDDIKSPTPEELAQKALAGHKTLSQKRWEWQGATIQCWKERAESLETAVDAFIEHVYRNDAGGVIDPGGLKDDKERIIARFEEQHRANFKTLAQLKG